MFDPKSIEIADYNYPLPEERIARYPLSNRCDSKLLVYREGRVEDARFYDLNRFLPADSLLIFNNTKVIQARLLFRKSSGAEIEVFCLEPAVPHDYALSLQATGSCSWYCMVGNAKKWKEGALEMRVELGEQFPVFTLSASVVASYGATKVIAFTWDAPIVFGELLAAVGELPIPPYLNRATEEGDKQTYQTVYSKIEGSVAAPTAGLHFTPELLESLTEQGVELAELTLHVGAGTFKPVKSVTLGDHLMHTEFIAVERLLIERLARCERTVVAVGTTSVRTLESLYYLGCAVIRGETPHTVSQWQPYTQSVNPTTSEALRALSDYLTLHGQERLIASTQIMIVPGYQFRIVGRIITNFHQPQSTLMLLVSAFVKGDWQTIYTHALTHEYRFLSYGDSSYLEPQSIVPACPNK